MYYSCDNFLIEQYGYVVQFTSNYIRDEPENVISPNVFHCIYMRLIEPYKSLIESATTYKLKKSEYLISIDDMTDISLDGNAIRIHPMVPLKEIPLTDKIKSKFLKPFIKYEQFRKSS